MRRLRHAARAASLTLAALALVIAGTACAGAAMDGEPSQPYGISITNSLDRPMVVSLDDGESTRMLGFVAAESTERFIIHDPASGTVTIIATDEEETRTVRRTVVLEAGGTVEVRLD